jgi:hypothetical protein
MFRFFVRANYLWELWTGLYMLDATEKVVFNAVIFSLLGVLFHFLPSIPFRFLTA